MKPGYLTTEFWLTVIVGVLTNVGTIDVPEKYRWIVNGALVLGYAISRGMAKYESSEPVTSLAGAEEASAIDALEQATLTAERTLAQLKTKEAAASEERTSSTVVSRSSPRKRSRSTAKREAA